MAATPIAKNVLATLWTTLLMASAVLALWPAFPSDHMAAAKDADASHHHSRSSSLSMSSQQKRLLMAPGGGGGGAGAGAGAGGRVEVPAPLASRDFLAEASCTCTKEFRSVDTRSRENELSVAELKNSLDGLRGVVATLRQALNAVSTTAAGKRAASQHNYNVAFSARVGYNRPYLGETEIIVFDELVINNGDFYDPYSGKFRSPVSGLYHFEATILSGFNDTIETMMVLNGNEVARIFSGGYQNRGSGSNSVLLNMQPGDEVWVSVFFGNGDYVHGLWSTFSGHIVYGAEA